MRYPQLARIAAYVEVLVVLIAFNLIASVLLKQFVSSETMALAQDFDQPNLYPGAAVSALRLVTRFGIGIAIGFGLLYWRRRVRPREMGVTLAGQSVRSLLGAGVLTWAVAALPFTLIFMINGVVPFGEGFEFFAGIDKLLPRLDFWAIWLAGALVLPPVLEEIFFRGYARTRLAEVYGDFGAVIIVSFIFMLAHGHFYAADAVKVATLIVSIYSAITWAWITLRTGSLVPAMTAHALGNMPWPRGDLAFMCAMFVVQVGLVASAWQPVRRHIADFVTAWKTSDRVAIVTGVGVVVVTLVPLMLFAT
jgi:membrane protease YdiL (CAAX protease family)